MAEAILLPQPKVDLSGYSLTSHNHDTVYSKLAHDHTGVYAPNVHTHSQYLTAHQDLSGYSLVGHTHSQYLTAHQSLAGYATQDWVKANTISDLSPAGLLGVLNIPLPLSIVESYITHGSMYVYAPVMSGATKIRITVLETKTNLPIYYLDMVDSWNGTSISGDVILKQNKTIFASIEQDANIDKIYNKTGGFRFYWSLGSYNYNEYQWTIQNGHALSASHVEIFIGSNTGAKPIYRDKPFSIKLDYYLN